jgi:hypothetical protein
MTRILIIQLCRLGDILQTTPMRLYGNGSMWS